MLTHPRCSVTDGITLSATGGRADMTHVADVEDAGMAHVSTNISHEINTRLGNLDAPLHQYGHGQKSRVAVKKSWPRFLSL
jgi:hypothetical protein